ncbi:MAG: hypothetical protein R3B12_02850 [Candidatus Saccharimonadales bacterium]
MHTYRPKHVSEAGSITLVSLLQNELQYTRTIYNPFDREDVER